MIKVKRALISVSDKTGVLDFARGLESLGVEIISTGGTARLLRQGKVKVTEVSDYTGSPEILDGRVKTLLPAIHGGLLALRDNPDHMDQLKEHNIGLIDMVVVNLYPFRQTVQKKNTALEEALENIDIGGPSMLRSAAKNFKSVGVISNPARYKEILKELRTNSGLLSDAVLMTLAIEAFEHTAEYDNCIYRYLHSRLSEETFSALPRNLDLNFEKSQDLRYGENPHQAAAFYVNKDALSGLAKLKQLHGKELSFNNLLDLNAAAEVIKDFSEPAAVIIKHNNPTGVARDKDPAKAYKNAWQCDPISAFGGIIGFNRSVDLKTAELVKKSGFMECVLAPAFDKDALTLLKKKKNLRLIRLNLKDIRSNGYDFKRVSGGLLLQDRDTKNISKNDLTVVTKKKPTKAQIDAMLFGWRLIKHIRSNAIILVKGTRTVGIGCGQTSRIESTQIAVRKAGKNAKGAVLISDAFLPKADNVTAAARAGINAIIQTGGSIADPDVIAEADKKKIAMVMTGCRHFKH